MRNQHAPAALRTSRATHIRQYQVSLEYCIRAEPHASCSIDVHLVHCIPAESCTSGKSNMCMLRCSPEEPRKPGQYNMRMRYCIPSEPCTYCKSNMRLLTCITAEPRASGNANMCMLHCIPADSHTAGNTKLHCSTAYQQIHAHHAMPIWASCIASQQSHARTSNLTCACVLHTSRDTHIMQHQHAPASLHASRAPYIRPS